MTGVSLLFDITTQQNLSEGWCELMASIQRAKTERKELMTTVTETKTLFNETLTDVLVIKEAKCLTVGVFYSHKYGMNAGLGTEDQDYKCILQYKSPVSLPNGTLVIVDIKDTLFLGVVLGETTEDRLLEIAQNPNIGMKYIIATVDNELFNNGTKCATHAQTVLQERRKEQAAKALAKVVEEFTTSLDKE